MNTTPTSTDCRHAPKARRRSYSKPLHPDSAVIDRLGGTMATAALLEVKGGSVTKWRYDGIPRARVMYLRVVRPDVFEATPDTPAPSAAPGMEEEPAHA